MAARLECLRRREDDEAAAAFDLLERGATLGRTQSAVEHDDGDAAAPERTLLVRHEGNEWRDDNRRPLEDHRRNLIDQRLSKAGRKRHERVASLKDSDHRRFLLRPEPLDAERPPRPPPAHIAQVQRGINPNEASDLGAYCRRIRNVANSIPATHSAAWHLLAGHACFTL